MAVAGAHLAPSAAHARPTRIVSINACTDQLLWALADRDQIAALTTHAVNPAMSIYTREVAESGAPLIRGSAEEVLKLKPDLVLAGSFTRAATRRRLAAFALRVETFAPADSIAAAKADIARVATLIGQEARGAALIAEIDAAVAEARGATRGLKLLQLQRAAYVTGEETLFSDILAVIGAENAAAERGGSGVRRVGLEGALKTDADALVLFDAATRASDQGAAILLHPALAARYPADRRIDLPANEIVCGGPGLSRLLRTFARKLAALPPTAGR
ncbi:MAG: ABC transporter substrate-binding protein [Hyphomicrobiales bacterium]|nr:ABC transporter substrate-binding protein [Hyphomicrobiales bacterium]